ncbi:hypothetical protein ACP0HM_09305 [Escherichia coli]
MGDTRLRESNKWLATILDTKTLLNSSDFPSVVRLLHFYWF